MKICIVSNGDAFDEKNWSGTPFNLASRFEKYDNVEVISLNLRETVSHPVYRFLQKTIGKIILIKGSPRDPLVFKHDAKIIQEQMDALQADIYLFCAEYCLAQNVFDNKAPFYYNYVDATMRPLIEADPKRKMGIELFLKKYEENERVCYGLLNGCFTMNEWTRNSIHQMYGFPKEKIYNVGFGINTNYYMGDKDYKTPHLLIVLRKGTEYYKGLDLVLEAFVDARKSIPELKLSVVGTEYEQIEGVTYYYNQPREITVELFRQATLYVMPAVREPNGITYLEALANKTPIVGLSRFAFPEFSGYGRFGFCVSDYNRKELAETIIKALSNPERLEEMGKQGQEFVKNKYNWDLVVSKMMEQFDKDLKEKDHIRK